MRMRNVHLPDRHQDHAPLNLKVTAFASAPGRVTRLRREWPNAGASGDRTLLPIAPVPWKLPQDFATKGYEPGSCKNASYGASLKPLQFEVP